MIKIINMTGLGKDTLLIEEASGALIDGVCRIDFDPISVGGYVTAVLHFRDGRLTQCRGVKLDRVADASGQKEVAGC